MITEQELKDKCTPEIIKKMCELAEGFGCEDYNTVNPMIKYKDNSDYNILLKYATLWILFPLLIHRAVEGWNNKRKNIALGYYHTIIIHHDCVQRGKTFKDDFYFLKNYSPENLTALECAMLDCLLEVLK